MIYLEKSKYKKKWNDSTFLNKLLLVTIITANIY